MFFYIFFVKLNEFRIIMFSGQLEKMKATLGDKVQYYFDEKHEEKNDGELLKVRQSNANVPGSRAQQTRKPTK